MGRGIPILEPELQTILDSFLDCRKRGMPIVESYKRVAEITGRDYKVIGTVIARFRPTTGMAKMYLAAKSMKLVRRLVRKASPAEIIDILERPSIGVLDPKKTEESRPGGFFISVNADSCGAVKIGAMTASAPAQLESGEFNPFEDIIDVGQGAQHENTAAESREITGTPQSSRVQSVIEGVRKRLAEAREESDRPRGRGGRSLSQEIGGFQGADGQTEE